MFRPPGYLDGRDVHNLPQVFRDAVGLTSNDLDFDGETEHRRFLRPFHP